MKFVVFFLAIFSAHLALANCAVHGRQLVAGDLIVFKAWPPGKLSGPERLISCDQKTDELVIGDRYTGGVEGNEHPKAASVVGVVDSKFKNFCDADKTENRILTFANEKDFGAISKDWYAAEPLSQYKNMQHCLKKGFVCGAASKETKIVNGLGGFGELWGMCRGMKLSIGECLSVLNEARKEAPASYKEVVPHAIGFTAIPENVAAFHKSFPTACRDNAFCQRLASESGNHLLKAEAEMLGCPALTIQ